MATFNQFLERHKAETPCACYKEKNWIGDEIGKRIILEHRAYECRFYEVHCETCKQAFIMMTIWGIIRERQPDGTYHMTFGQIWWDDAKRDQLMKLAKAQLGVTANG